jgi:L-threonylcarbamoyladenylate synthase
LQDEEAIEKAAQILRDGGLVAFPTETVYGLGADAANPAAVRKVFQAKGRPPDHPLIVHIPDTSALKNWAAEVPRGAWLLAEKYWPGPLTIILERAAHVSDVVTGGQRTLGLRVPSHPMAQRLLRAFGGGIAAPSANRYGHLSPTNAQHVRDDLGAAVDCILDGGACPVGIESTIVDLSGSQPALLRPGQISARQIEDALLAQLAAPSAASPRAPGTMASHYAPRLPLKLVPPEQIEAYLRKDAAGIASAVLARRNRPRDTQAALWQVAPEAPQAYAQQLYGLLRRLDTAGCQWIIAELPPDLPEWTAIRDRLTRAATPEPAAQGVRARR